MRKKKRLESPASSISKAEWMVMRILWEGGALTANQVVERLEGRSDWKPKTIHTLLRRLTDKGVLAVTRQGREYVFQPTVEEKDCQMAESLSFLERVFGGGSLTPLVAAFVEQRQLSERERTELRRLLEEGGES